MDKQVAHLILWLGISFTWDLGIKGFAKIIPSWFNDIFILELTYLT